MAFLKSIGGGIAAIVLFCISYAAMQAHNDILMVITFLLMIFAALYTMYEWNKGD
jgi:hypothetical protein